MAKTNHFKTVTFTEDFATHKAGDDLTCDGMLASNLVNRNVAVYKDQPTEAPVIKPVIKKTKKSKKK